MTMRLTEWLGPSAWSERMLSMLDALWQRAPHDTPAGNLVSLNEEVNGEMLQTLSRVYWMTGEERYLDWAIRLGDYYLLGDNHPTDHFSRLRLRDHGCEVVSGLTELYATVYYAKPEKYEAYKAPIHRMLDRILEVGRNEHGLFHNLVNPVTGNVMPLRQDSLPENMADTYGYTLNGYYTVYHIDSTEAYREAVVTALSNLEPHYKNYDWESGSSDGYADATESALNLYNRLPAATVTNWLDSEIEVMWSKQQDDGVIEGWHGDGNFARTSLMYALWKTKGLRVEPWRSDLRLGAEQQGDTLFVYLRSESDWEGRLIPDIRRHSEYLHLPFDWTRINQFPEWFTVSDGENVVVIDLNSDTQREEDSESLLTGISLALSAGEQRRLMLIREVP